MYFSLRVNLADNCISGFDKKIKCTLIVFKSRNVFIILMHVP